MKFHSESLDEILKSRALNDDGELDFDNFLAFVAMPSPIEEWVRSLPFNQLIADAMPKDDSLHSKDQLRDLSRITEKQLEVSCDVIREHLLRILKEQLAILEDVYDKWEIQKTDDNNAKFQISGMSVGNLENFHQGLAARIGKLRC